MGEREKRAPAELVERHHRVFAKLAHGAEFFDRTSRLDFRLVEAGRADLADALAIVEERLVAAAEAAGQGASKPGGVQRLLDADPELGEQFDNLLAEALEALGRPEPEAFGSAVQVAPDLFLTGQRSTDFPLLRKRRIDPSRN